MSVKRFWKMECPRCKRDDGLEITVTNAALLTADGTVEFGDHEWHDHSACRCQHCDFEGYVHNFETDDI